jgi:hypothetical protein
VLSGRVLCVRLITRPDESYRVWVEASMMRSCPTRSCCIMGKKSVTTFIMFSFLLLNYPGHLFLQLFQLIFCVYIFSIFSMSPIVVVKCLTMTSENCTFFDYLVLTGIYRCSGFGIMELRFVRVGSTRIRSSSALSKSFHIDAKSAY